MKERWKKKGGTEERTYGPKAMSAAIFVAKEVNYFDFHSTCIYQSRPGGRHIPVKELQWVYTMFYILSHTS